MYDVEKLAGLWLPKEMYDSVAQLVKAPALFAYVEIDYENGHKPKLDMRNMGEAPDKFDCFQVVKVPSMAMPPKEQPQIEDNSHQNDDPHVELKTDGDQVTQVGESDE